MDKNKNQNECTYKGESKLFSHYRQFFDEFVVKEFRRKNASVTSFQGHMALMNEIETYVKKATKYDTKVDYYNLVDTLKLLSENEV
ncbi:MAG: hypothetical protein CMB82_00895 [Flammeovirgaceae bacterium]|nr:hypothetical protein [Flammeovirgaceae bacterium]|tara:strand:+ start:971 stop:1228 length:258 start_codon:yes stop_codon:yes gene_type:complete